jgi:hypothetical protein
MRVTALALIGALAIAASALFACAQVAGIDVTYADGGTTSANQSVDGGSGGGEGGQVGSPEASVAIPVVTDASFAAPDAGSPVWPSCLPDDAGWCDGTQGLGCCFGAGGTASCIDVASAATACKGGIFIGCQQTDPTTESVCCWNDGMGAGASSLFSASCGNRPMACTDDSQCPGGKCAKTTCGTLEIGACGSTAPECPK